MSNVVPLSIKLPAASTSSSPLKSISKPSVRKLVPVGGAYASHARRQMLKRTFEEDDKATEEEEKKKAEELAKNTPEDDGVGEELESNELLESDPKDWKNLDMYAVLGLSGLRYKATQDQIRRAHKKKVLRHHPDKKAGRGGDANDDSFFKCVAKALEILDNPEKRRQFDSIDEAIDNSIPPAKLSKTDSFFNVYGPVFERESRFSEGIAPQDVPKLGDENSSRDAVEDFYNAWYNFKSWRSFEWYDKEINEGSENRDDKRYTEKKNKNDRAQRKKDDNTRVRILVDQALANDPRMKKFRQEDKAMREAKKNKAKGIVVEDPKKAAEDKAQKEAQEAKEKEEQLKRDAETKAASASNKKAKEAARKNLNKAKKAIKQIVTDSNYFQAPGTTPSANVIESQLNELDLIANGLEPEETSELKKNLDGCKDIDSKRSAIVACATKLVEVGKVENGRFKQFI